MFLTQTLKIPLKTSNLWTIACIDLQHHLENFDLLPKGIAKGLKYSIKSFEICSNLTIRGIYTSDNLYDWDSLPREMSFKMVKGGKWSELYNFLYLPSSIDPEESRKVEKEKEDSLEIEPKFEVTENKAESIFGTKRKEESRILGMQ